MSLVSHRKLALGGAAILLIAFGAAVWAYYHKHQLSLDLLSITGAIASTIGLFIIFLQVSAIRSTSEAAHEAAQSTRNKVMAFLSVLDIARTVKLVQEIQTYNRLSKREIAIHKMQDLKYILKDILNNPRLNEIVNKQLYHHHIKDISIQIGSLEKEMQRPSENFNTAKMNQVFETILNDLMDLDTRVKQVGGRDDYK
jgi:hypothetical protein